MDKRQRCVTDAPNRGARLLVNVLNGHQQRASRSLSFMSMGGTNSRRNINDTLTIACNPISGLALMACAYATASYWLGFLTSLARVEGRRAIE